MRALRGEALPPSEGGFSFRLRACPEPRPLPPPRAEATLRAAGPRRCACQSRSPSSGPLPSPAGLRLPPAFPKWHQFLLNLCERGI